MLTHPHPRLRLVPRVRPRVGVNKSNTRMADLLARRETAFVLWHVPHSNPPPELIIGWLQPGTPLMLIGQQSFQLRPAAGFTDLWEMPAAECNLVDGWVY